MSTSEESEKDSDSEEESKSESSEEERKRKRKKKGGKSRVKTKRVATDGKKKRSDVDEVGELTRQLTSLRVSDTLYAATFAKLQFTAPSVAEHLPLPAGWSRVQIATAAPPQPSPSSAPVMATFQHNHPNRLTNRNYPPNCFFCQKPGCRIRDCPDVIAYVKAGRIIYASDGKIVFFDGSLIGYSPSGMKAAVDARCGGPLENHQPTAVTTFYQGTAFAVETGIEEVVGENREMEELVKEGGEENTVVWGAFEDLERMDKMAESYVTTRAGGRKKLEKEALKKKAENITETGTRGGDEGKISTENTYGKERAYSYESKIADPQAANKLLDRILEAVIPNVTVGDIVSLSGDVRKAVVEQLRTVRNPHKSNTTWPVADVASIQNLMTPLEFCTPLREIEVALKGKTSEWGLLDEGSEIVVVRRDLWEELGFKVNRE
ncbi:hypothetical protein BYT27DRAFT_7249452 [Phlegmacium glaucopus]|nr:hypothetical protein BYT27DRAFT_7249452 [Phlegmacium glaucopus]